MEIVTYNGSENVNMVMKHTLQEVNISHTTTSYYHPHGKSRVEQFHCTLHEIMSKKVSDSHDSWDIYLNQVLAAFMSNVSESTKFSPFYLLYNHDPVLLIDNTLKPRRRYLEKHVICNGTSTFKEG